jgi:hypothetical protein
MIDDKYIVQNPPSCILKVNDTDELQKKSADIYEWLDFLTMSIKENKRLMAEALATGETVKCYAGENDFVITMINREKK